MGEVKLYCKSVSTMASTTVAISLDAAIEK